VTLFISLLLISTYSIHPVYLDGNRGFYTSSSSFNKPHHFQFILRESYGIKGERYGEDSKTHNQVSFNLAYTPIPFLELSSGLNYYTMEEEEYTGLFLRSKLPFLTIGKLKSSLSPMVVFAQHEKPKIRGNIDMEIHPFSHENLPQFLLGESIRFGRENGNTLVRSSSLLTLSSKRFSPFIEFTTTFYGGFSRDEMIDSRVSVGLGLVFGNMILKTGVELPIDEYSERDFDYRVTGEFNFLFNPVKKPHGSLRITIIDSESGEPLPATVMLKGKEVIKICESSDGTCRIDDILFGIYTIEISNPGYKMVRAPISINKKEVEKVYKLTKKESEKGGDISE
jgi:hypothetical protein